MGFLFQNGCIEGAVSAGDTINYQIRYNKRARLLINQTNISLLKNIHALILRRTSFPIMFLFIEQNTSSFKKHTVARKWYWGREERVVLLAQFTFNSATYNTNKYLRSHGLDIFIYMKCAQNIKIQNNSFKFYSSPSTFSGGTIWNVILINFFKILILIHVWVYSKLVVKHKNIQ